MKNLIVLQTSFYILQVIYTQDSVPISIAKSVSSELRNLDFYQNRNDIRKYAFDMIGQGDFMGYFSQQEFWEIHKIFNDEHSDFVSKKIEIGESFLKDKMYAFAVGNQMNSIENLQDLYKLEKSIILFTGVHHAREPQSVSMHLAILAQNLITQQLSKVNTENTIFHSIIQLFVPVVNIDSYRLITDSFLHKKNKYGRVSGFNFNKMIRKNRRDNQGVECSYMNVGVDLNRNYGQKFGADDQGSSGNFCQEDFRGPEAFSESETQAIKNTVENLEPYIVSAMNFHCWGNLWIHPFSYDKSNDNNELINRTDWNQKYNYLEKNLKWPINAQIGNAKKAIFYTSNGEASDWMLGAKNILAYSPELGNSIKSSENFYIPSNIHKQVIQDDYKLVEDFINAHNLKMQLLDIFISVTNHKQPEQLKITSDNIKNSYRMLENDLSSEAYSYYVFFNKGQSNHYNLQISLSTEESFLKSVIAVSTAEFDLKNIDKKFDPKHLKNFDNKFFANLFSEISLELDFQIKMHSKLTLYDQNAKKGHVKKNMTELKIFDVMIPRFSFIIIRFTQSHIALSKNMTWKFNSVTVEKSNEFKGIGKELQKDISKDLKNNDWEIDDLPTVNSDSSQKIIQKYNKTVIQQLETNLENIDPKIIKQISDLNIEMTNKKISSEFQKDNNIKEIKFQDPNPKEIKSKPQDSTTPQKENVVMKDLVNEIEKQPQNQVGYTNASKPPLIWRILKIMFIIYLICMVIAQLGCLYHYYKRRNLPTQISEQVPQTSQGPSELSI